MSIGNIIFGNPLKTENLEGQSLPKKKALAVFSADLLSTVSYAPEEILISLATLAAFGFSFKIAVCIAFLMIIICSSYMNTIKEYPNGGGAFSVAYKNFGENVGLLAAAVLFFGYTLTVAVSLSASVNAITSAFPELQQYSINICIFCIILIALFNLRGSKGAANIFTYPTYTFIITIFVLIVCGLFADIDNTCNTLKRTYDFSLAETCMIFHAFAYGCTVMSGIESISCSVPSFEKPRTHNAKVTLFCVVTILLSMFLGITYIAQKLQISPSNTETVLSQIARISSGGTGIMYYFTQIMTSIILLMAANTSFSSFPRLASVLAKERYIPTSFANIGDRLAFSNGIVFLAVFSGILVVAFNCDTHSLIPLYSCCIFLSFSLSQAGLLVHLIREKKANWYIKAICSVVGTAATTLIFLTVLLSKFFDGSWLFFVVIPVSIILFRGINKTYKKTHRILDLKNGGFGNLIRAKNMRVQPTVVVPISRIHKGTISALKFAQTLSSDVVAVIVNINQKETEKVKLAWDALNFFVPLVILESPYRSIITPLLEYLKKIDKTTKNGEPAIVVLPSFIPGELWQNILHNQTATILKTALFYKEKNNDNVRIVVDVPYKLVD